MASTGTAGRPSSGTCKGPSAASLTSLTRCTLRAAALHDPEPALGAYVDRLVLTPGQCLVVDLSGLDFCDSSGITALPAARRRAQASGADLVLAAVPVNTLRILTVVGLDRVFTIRP